MTTTSVGYAEENEISSQKRGKIVNLIPQSSHGLDILSATEQLPFNEHSSLATSLYETDSFIEGSNKHLIIPRYSDQTQKKSELALKVFRTHYSKRLISNLEWLSENHEINSPLSIPYVSTILILIREYCDSHFDDPYSSFLLALFDGLTINESYLSINNSQYNRILEYLKVLNDQELTYKKIDKYILKLEEIGLNITPY